MAGKNWIRIRYRHKFRSLFNCDHLPNYNSAQDATTSSVPGLRASAVACLPNNQTFQRSNHYTAAIEQRFGENIRLRAQVFDRQSNARLMTDDVSTCALPSATNVLQTVQRKYSRGFNLVFQRRSANRLSGWLGYTCSMLKRVISFQAVMEREFSALTSSIQKISAIT